MSIATLNIESKQNVSLPEEGKRNILITSALPYVNNIPHLGNLIGCVLSADVFARYCRSREYNTIYVCGTDEYGTATETKAIEEKTTPQEICNKYHKIHCSIYQWFDISFDIFGRTSTPNHKKIVQEIFSAVHVNGYTEEKEMEQLYCTPCNMSLADRFVLGTCPKCSSQNCRGDQCEACGELVDATKLIEPRCKQCNSIPKIVNSNHIFLDLTKIRTMLEAWIEKASNEGDWTKNSRNTTSAWLSVGLKPRCITRDLTWGVPVPIDRFKNKVFYVWFDAPIGYISITANLTDKWELWWKNNNNVKLYQFMGKDNIPFHTVTFPSTLLASDMNYTLLHHISTTEFLNYEDGKFSKSHKTGVFGDDAINSGIPSDVYRYYLLANRPETSDTMFTWADLQSKNNNDLLNNLGNFYNRSLSFIKKKYDGKVPSKKQETDEDKKFKSAISDCIINYINALESVKIKEGIRIILQMSSIGNQYFQESAPWKLESNTDRRDTVVNLCVQLSAILTILQQPFIPSFTNEISKQLLLPSNLLVPNTIVPTYRIDLQVFNDWALLPDSHLIGNPSPLVKKIDNAQVEELKKRYSGKKEVNTPVVESKKRHSGKKNNLFH